MGRAGGGGGGGGVDERGRRSYSLSLIIYDLQDL